MINQNMPDYSNLNPIFERLIDRWQTSPTAFRVESVDGLAVSTGKAIDWDGVTIPEFILDLLKDYTEILRSDPALLIDPRVKQEEFRKELQGFLDKESTLIEEADTLSKDLKEVRFGFFNPRFHIIQKRLSAVVDKFKLSGDDYHKHLPSFKSYE